MKTIVKFGFGLFVIGIIVYSLNSFNEKWSAQNVEIKYNALKGKSGVVAAKKNYSKKVKAAADEFDVPFEYLMALIMLESGGRCPSGVRFEPHIYDRLEKVRAGQKSNYEKIKTKTLKDANDEALINLSTSWGPFQLMGYKCVGMDVNVSDIRGEECVYFGVKWIDEEYGKQLRKGNFKNAFHIHNTGRKFPKNGKSRTHDPDYVENGLKYMELFK